ncbi:MAP7 domain-containing protein 1-like [Heliangelus exortis]|uniref:MAP7 domain-containing protein 1-like n=1 Tax=Heliangelus exortis TaxID=472823 RepID=UPI003A8E6AAB
MKSSARTSPLTKASLPGKQELQSGAPDLSRSPNASPKPPKPGLPSATAATPQRRATPNVRVPARSRPRALRLPRDSACTAAVSGPEENLGSLCAALSEKPKAKARSQKPEANHRHRASPSQPDSPAPRASSRSSPAERPSCGVSQVGKPPAAKPVMATGTGQSWALSSLQRQLQHSEEMRDWQGVMVRQLQAKVLKYRTRSRELEQQLEAVRGSLREESAHSDLEQLRQESSLQLQVLGKVSEEKELLVLEKAALEGQLAATERDRQDLSEQLAEARSVKETLESKLLKAQHHSSQLEITRNNLEIQLDTVTQAKEAVHSERLMFLVSDDPPP